MKTILILFVIALAECDKLDKLYLPPIGANYSGGSFEDTIPFQVPAGKYTDSKNHPENRFISSIDSKEIDSGRGSLISPTKSVSIVPFSDEKKYDEITRGLSNQPINIDAYSPPQYSNGGTTDPSTSIVEKEFEGSTLSANTRLSQSNAARANNNDSNPVKIDNIVVPNTVNYVNYPERVTRPLAETDRKAVILNYDNVITPEGFGYSYNTSNGIHADEKGTAIDGVKADGSFSYVGDDGKLYNVTYSADENGFQPRGDHLPTSPPIPDAILKVIEQAARDKNNGLFDDGSYDANKYGYQKYQTPQERFLSINKPMPARKYNRVIGKESKNTDNNNIRNGNLNSGGSKYFAKSTTNPPFYKSGGKIIDDLKTTSVNGQTGLPDKLQTVNLRKEPNKDTQLGTIDRKFYQNQEPSGTDLLNARIIQSEGYKYPSPSNKFDLSDFNNNKGLTNYDYQNPGINRQSYSNKNTDGNNKSKTTFIEDKGLNQQNNNDKFTEPKQGDYGNKAYKFEQQIIPSETLTRGPYDNFSTVTTSKPVLIPQLIKTEEQYAEPGTQFYTNDNLNYQKISSTSYPSNGQVIGQVDSDTGRPSNFYSPSTTVRIENTDNDTGRTTNFFDPSLTDGIKQIDTYTGRPNSFYAPSSTEGIQQIDTYTGQPTSFYAPSSTERIQQIDKITGKPNNFYDPLSTERIEQIDSYTRRPNKFYDPSSTESIKQIESYAGVPNGVYGPSSTKNVQLIGTYTDRPSNSYDPLSSEIIKQINPNSGQSGYFYDPPSIDRLKETETYTVRQNDIYSLSSTERTNEIGEPSDYYGPSSTERIKQFDTYINRPNYSPVPPSKAGTKETITYTDRRNDFYSPSSADKIKPVSTAGNLPQGFETVYNGKSSDLHGPSSTERLQLGTYTDGPNDDTSNYRETDRNDAYTEQPNSYYGPSSTERTKQYDTFIGRSKPYNSPSSAERTKQVGYTSAAGEIIGEHFVGPKQPQSYNPETGYHY